jgi:23S rRNA pseudouridine955/2504/2580 synthase/23S rRNA pseudouridine1911/1915/1917 synthase
MKRRIKITLPPGQKEVALLDFLASRFTYHTRDQWNERIAEQRVLVDDTPAAADRLLLAGETVEFIAQDVAEPPVCFDIAVVFEDYDLMVINKPANLPCHPAGRYFNHTLWAFLKTRHCLEAPILVNRLDRETSGLLVVAKHPGVEAKCRAQFARRQVVKRYIVLVEGLFPDSLQARGWMRPDPESGVHKRRRFEPSALTPEPRTLPPPDAPPGAEWAETDFRRLNHVNGVSEVEAVLHTGRLHQIRATLHSLGFPVVGDKLYGPDPMMFVRFCTDSLTAEDRRRLRMDRQALHAMELEFRHPGTDQLMHFEAPLPPDMAAILGR